MNDLSNFLDYELFPSLFDRVPQAFPEFDFKRKGRNWVSRCHLSGTRDKQGKEITYIYENRKYAAVEHTEGRSVQLLKLYQELNGVDFITALRALCEICGLSVPRSDSEEWKKYEEKQRNRQHDNEVFVSALWGSTPEAEKVREYLHGRKWTDEQIKKAELGLITDEVKKSLSDSYNSEGVGTTHLLTIPYRNGSRIFGFKFREVGVKTANKYLNTYGLQKGKGLFGIGVGVKDLVLVEGELDALHARAMGADSVVSTSGGRATEEQIRDAVRRGVEKFTLLFDNDEKGKSYIYSTIEEIGKTGKSMYVAELPQEYKDLDEYLGDHTIEELDGIIRAAYPYAIAVLNGIVRKYAEKGELTRKDREDFFVEVSKLLNSNYIKPYEREDVITKLRTYEEALNFKVEDFRAWADNEYNRNQERKRADRVRKVSRCIAEAAEGGRIDEALEFMRVTSEEVSRTTRESEYARVFATLTPSECEAYLSEIKEGLPTGFIFKQKRQSERLTLNTGLTFICGYRGHGKTSFLNNLALNEARRNVQSDNGKSVLYFSYEVDKRRLTTDLLNTFVNDGEISLHPSDTILSYFKGEGARYFKNDTRSDGLTRYDNFLRKKDVFLREYIHKGALVIVDENYKVEKLLDAIKYYTSTRPVSLVCVDYAQLIYSEDYTRQRTEEIKKVVNDIKDFANKEGLPFVMAAQFNREVDSPVSVDTKNIGEGGDFERIADTCIGLFNLKELHPLPKAQEEEKAAKKLLTDLRVATYAQGDQLKPIEGKMFVRLMKRRYGYYPLDTILDWDGRTKYIKPNDEGSLEPQQKELFHYLEDEEEEDAPF